MKAGGLKGILLVLMLALSLILVGCGGGGGDDDDDNGNGNGGGGGSNVLFDNSVNVGAGGGNAEISFNASNGQRIRIELTADKPSMEPYGFLQNPDGSGDYHPQGGTASGGNNSEELNLNQTGAYNLQVFDASNQGGSVHVKVTVI